jgi:muconolactone delta-isomerase
MNQVDYPRMKQTIVDFAVTGVQKFLQAHPNLEFYAFAFDCNAEYAEINLCLNTEADFAKTLKESQARYPEDYQSEDNIKDLRYNTGDWEYQCFDTLYILTDEQLSEIFQAMPEDDYQTWQKFVGSLVVMFTEALQDFTKTETYKTIPKTQNFMAFCIDHDEDFETALSRMKQYA